MQFCHKAFVHFLLRDYSIAGLWVHGKLVLETLFAPKALRCCHFMDCVMDVLYRWLNHLLAIERLRWFLVLWPIVFSLYFLAVVWQLLLTYVHERILKHGGVETLLRLVTLEILEWVHGLLTPKNPIISVVVVIVILLNRIFLIATHIEGFLLLRQARHYLVSLTAGVFSCYLLA